MSVRELKARQEAFLSEAKVIITLYKEAVSPDLRHQLEVAYEVTSLAGLDQKKLLDEIITQTQIEEAMLLKLDYHDENDSLVDTYGELIQLNGTPVDFYIPNQLLPEYGPPYRINSLLLKKIISSSSWSGIMADVLPFMKKHLPDYTSLLLNAFNIEIQLQDEIDREEGEKHFNELLSQYGEDIFYD